MRSTGKPVSVKYKNPTFSRASRSSERNAGFVMGFRARSKLRIGIDVNCPDAVSFLVPFEESFAIWQDLIAMTRLYNFRQVLWGVVQNCKIGVRVLIDSASFTIKFDPRCAYTLDGIPF